LDLEYQNKTLLGMDNDKDQDKTLLGPGVPGQDITWTWSTRTRHYLEWTMIKTRTRHYLDLEYQDKTLLGPGIPEQDITWTWSTRTRHYLDLEYQNKAFIGPGVQG
jgi:hypothetical protein